MFFILPYKPKYKANQCFSNEKKQEKISFINKINYVI
jgi:hypothetical protein